MTLGFDVQDKTVPRRKPGARRSVVILGATGSIGTSTADVILNSNGAFDVVAVAGGRDPIALAKVARELGARFAALADPSGYDALKEALQGTGIKAAAGREAVIEAALQPADIVVGAIAGTAGVEPTYAALSAGRTVALANKECLVCAGAVFIHQAKAMGTRLLPVDSEHNAIFQALGDADSDTIEMMTLTASGGPFRSWTAEAIAKATPEQALKHPNWAMGSKVTIDSAGLMNKGLEVIEAHHIFGIEAERLDVLVHAQSVVHGLVAFRDGSVTAGLAAPDMRVPIAHCLSYPERLTTRARRLDLAAVGQLTFERPDFDRFPALRVALDALRTGQGLPTVLNAANEVAVEAFLNRRISFHDIARLVEACCEAALRDGTAAEPASIEEALAVDHIARESARTLLARGEGFGKLTTC
ncbi:1-deoxy-D-xylulose-5-phosphate reductoisomerase [Methylovirgula ligni]|uniref:1-deoxy-D-xylulose 5-phosphate reductoisomerase n=1 Tax=Methylovirgula ligni TaxID=569860 RepID=A0A3D9YZ97_9HYPH|nr:1-deoxy-D-xylulose-5-phosphate reductoisomerase [Methylovirgula ligni]QAY96472.1 1-deoxy-D-xylulose-5-phosphate reductoisomerase [Methylovirgula ligni]REF84239.1 1-deoxy-D-xylulose 5-phosphate reductoisomerase [Methylovirgula ligni]